MCISPLTSLMIDQRAKFSPRGLRVEFVGEAQTDSLTERRVLKGHVQLLYISPESAICNSKYRSMFMSPPYRENLVTLAVDEAHCVTTWGNDFRTAFSLIGELRSVFPRSTRVLALTATATPDTVRVVSQRLSMVDPNIVALPPYRENIFYKINQKIDVEAFAESMCTELRSRGVLFPKTVVYVRTYSDCCDIYMSLKHKLGPDITEPSNYPNTEEFRVLDMFTRVLTAEKKDSVLANFAQRNGKLQLLIATTAFGMGVDCPDIRRIVHWGIPATLEEYIQETGRAGRDGKPSVAIVYPAKRSKNTSPMALHYESNTTVCRRRLLFKEFLLYSESDILNVSECCDICDLQF